MGATISGLKKEMFSLSVEMVNEAVDLKELMDYPISVADQQPANWLEAKNLHYVLSSALKDINIVHNELTTFKLKYATTNEATIKNYVGVLGNQISRIKKILEGELNRLKTKKVFMNEELKNKCINSLNNVLKHLNRLESIRQRLLKLI